ncbi:MAG: DUF6600 domain-containing protein [Bacteroidales bacterium]
MLLLPIRARHALVAILLVIAATVGASAQDPPGRVARLNYISGQVSFRPASLDDWGTANINYPLTTGDHLWTEPGARAELHLGPSVIRLASETAFAFLDLDDNVVQARVAEGSIFINVRELGQYETYEIDTPNAAVSLVRTGVYRVDVEPDGTVTRVTVRTGLAEVNGADGAFSVNAGDSAEVSGTDEMIFDIGRALAPDAWERWCRARDEREANRVSLRYVSSSMVGYEDLDDYGTWSYEPEYGYAWTPTVVAVDWAPYRYGHWSWVAPWGWTWVDDARWGFAPFHYGRWAHHHDRWMWLPGHYYPHPVYAPALVGFVGGLDWSLTFNLMPQPAVGWFPLGPGEAYCPSYRASPAYVHNVNVTQVNVTGSSVATYNVGQAHYANRNVPGAVTAVPREVFVGGQSVRRAAVAVPRQSLDRAPVIGHAIAVAPETRSMVGRSGSAVPRPPLAASRRAVLARSEPPAGALRNTPVVALDNRARTRGTARPAAPDSQAAVPTDRRADADANGGARARVRTNANADDNGAWRPGPERGNTSATRQDNVSTRSPQPSTTAPETWRPAVRGTDVPTTSAPASAPRYGRPAETAAPAPRYERSSEPDRTAPRTEAPSEDRPTRGREQTAVRDTPATQRGDAPNRNDNARSDSARERSSAPSADRPASAPAAAAPPAERGGERRPPASTGGRGGPASGGSAKPRGRG